jgi:hypothetical protein
MEEIGSASDTNVYSCTARSNGETVAIFNHPRILYLRGWNIESGNEAFFVTHWQKVSSIAANSPRLISCCFLCGSKGTELYSGDPLGSPNFQV